MSLLRFAWTRIFYSLFFSFSVVFSALAIESGNGFSPVYIAASVMVVMHFGCYLFLFNYKEQRHFHMAFSICLFIILGTIITAALTVHEDFCRSAFHAGAQLFLVSIYQRENLYKARNGKEQIRILYYAALVMVIFGLFWVVMMGMSGVVFKVQAVRNWMVFNFYSGGTIILSVDPILSLKEKLFTQLKVTENTIHIDGHDYSQLLGEKEIGVLHVFLNSPEFSANCSTILEKIGEPSSKCSECLENRNKATLCPDYKRLYNQINKIKRFTETMQVATILPPQNKMEITREGWTLHLFSNVKAKC